jgi:hypothetical protein
MRSVYLFTLIAYLALTAQPCAAQSAEPWLPITPEDLAVKEVPGNPSAPAIRLYYSYFRNDDKKFELRYERIKVLNDAGRSYANVEIPLEPKDSLKDLKARTIHPDGSIIEFTDKPFEKTLLKARGFKYLAETFTLPQVTVGSIVEFSYALNMGNTRLERVTEWQLQSDLYTVKERFRFQPFVGFLGPRPINSLPGPPRPRVACDYQNQVGAPIPQRGKDGFRELELKNVAPFDTEDFMPPEADYRSSMLCYYGSGPLFSYDIFWQSWQKLMAEGTDNFIGNPAALREAVARAIGDETDPERKLRKIYALAQQTRNLSYERERTANEEKGEKLKHNSSAADVLHHGYGDHWEIDALFIGLARAAGFDASMLMVSDRQERSFNKYILWLGQLTGWAVMVNVNGTPMILDPGTRFCPFGVLVPRYSETTALVVKAGGGFLTTAPAPPSSIHRIVNIALLPDGSAKCQMSVELKGPRALEERLDALKTDEAGRRESFEAEVSAWLPSGAMVKMTESDGWGSSEDPLTAKFTVEMHSLASVTNNRLIVPAYLLSSLRKRIFTSDSRMYPVDFGYPFSQHDELRLQLPEGYSLEESPHPRKAQLPWAGYEFSTVVEGNQLVINRTLRLEKSLFQPQDYAQLKNLFSIVQAGDSSQAVLQLKQAAGLPVLE